MVGGLLGNHGEHVQNLVEMELKPELGLAQTQSRSIMERLAMEAIKTAKSATKLNAL